MYRASFTAQIAAIWADQALRPPDRRGHALSVLPSIWRPHRVRRAHQAAMFFNAQATNILIYLNRTASELPASRHQLQRDEPRQQRRWVQLTDDPFQIGYSSCKGIDGEDVPIACRRQCHETEIDQDAGYPPRRRIGRDPAESGRIKVPDDAVNGGGDRAEVQIQNDRPQNPMCGNGAGSEHRSANDKADNDRTDYCSKVGELDRI